MNDKYFGLLLHGPSVLTKILISTEFTDAITVRTSLQSSPVGYTRRNPMVPSQRQTQDTPYAYLRPYSVHPCRQLDWDPTVDDS